MISSSRLAEAQHPHQLRSSAPRKAKSVSTAKVRSSVLMTKGCRAFLIAGIENHGAATNSDDGPGATRFRDGRTTARPLRLRRGPAAPAAHALARANPESAQAYLAQNLLELAFEQETRGKHRELKRKLSERAPTQRKARAREEPSPGPPASETDARPLGHQPRSGARRAHG